MTQAAASNTEDRALSLLGSGVDAEAVASALGVSPSRISQLLANKEFAEQVALLRYQNLQEHNARDATYDVMEDKLLKKLEKAMPLMFRPSDILKAIQVINGAKRRGQSAPNQVTNQQNIVSLTLPVQMIQKYVTNVNNQVVQAGDQDLLTMQSGRLLDLAETTKSQNKEIANDNSERENQKDISELGL